MRDSWFVISGATVGHTFSRITNHALLFLISAMSAGSTS